MVKTVKRQKASSSAAPETTLFAGLGPEFRKGDQVLHPQFGKGSVVEVEPTRLTIAFRTMGTKIIAAGFVKRA